jgi:hypothetical protein
MSLKPTILQSLRCEIAGETTSNDDDAACPESLLALGRIIQIFLCIVINVLKKLHNSDLTVSFSREEQPGSRNEEYGEDRPGLDKAVKTQLLHSDIMSSF